MSRALCWNLALAACVLLLPLARAGADDDYRAGQQAFARGDVVGAMTPLRRGAAAGHAPSQSLLGFILENAGLVDEAAGLYRQAAAQGHADAQAALAGLYLVGRGVPHDEREAFVLFSRAAASGHATAIKVVADVYLRDDVRMLGDDRSDALALAALRRAAEADHLPTIDRLVLVYQRGELGVPADAAEAERWQARAAKLRPRPPAAGSKK